MSCIPKLFKQTAKEIKILKNMLMFRKEMKEAKKRLKAKEKLKVIFIKALMDYIKILPIKTGEVYTYSFEVWVKSNEEINIAGERLMPLQGSSEWS